MTPKLIHDCELAPWAEAPERREGELVIVWRIEAGELRVNIASASGDGTGCWGMTDDIAMPV